MEHAEVEDQESDNETKEGKPQPKGLAEPAESQNVEHD
jgi:hypothetical protein